jgi:hypothetical protein
MVTETELAQALDNILPYVVTKVINCGEEGCEEPNCWSCWGSEKAEAESTIAEAIFQASGKVLKAWKASRATQKCDCDASEFYCCVMPPICPEYLIGHDGYCANCWHNKECHQS